MNVIKVVPSGYCKGVIGAIKKVKETIAQYPNQPIYIMGMIVHNRYVVEAFENEGVTTLYGDKMEELSKIDHGVVIFTAHGIDPKIKQYAIDKGLIVVDGACSDVIKNSQLVSQHLQLGYEVIYIGKKNHPESDAVIALSNRIHLVTNAQDINNLQINNDKILVTNQTTTSTLEIKNLIELIQAKFPSCKVVEEICNATKRRQQAIIELEDVDCLIVVGDPGSNNTSQLANIAKEKGIKNIYKVETANDLVNIDFSSYHNIAVTAGASTPQYLTNQLIEYIKSNDVKYLSVDLKEILSL